MVRQYKKYKFAAGKTTIIEQPNQLHKVITELPWNGLDAIHLAVLFFYFNNLHQRGKEVAVSHQLKYVVLYERLSHDDEQLGESNSISHQKEMLEEYSSSRGIRNFRHFTDDGISGTRFDRPGFTEMMDEVNMGHISMVVVKDMSRYGRDHLKVGQLMELLR